jgi:hypothetical protein
MIIEVLTEGASDVPVIREMLTRHFQLAEHIDFTIHAHRGRGSIPADIHAQPLAKHRGLLDQLPAKLRGYGRYMDNRFLVLVLIDADNDDPTELLNTLHLMLAQLQNRPPRVLFKLAVEETESWFLADRQAILKAIPKANLGLIQFIAPDAIVGAWEKLAQCIGRVVSEVDGADKTHWAKIIAPHLNFSTPNSPSLAKLVSGIKRELGV